MLASCLRIAILVLLLACATGEARAGEARAGEARAGEARAGEGAAAGQGGWLDGYNRLIFRFNEALYGRLQEAEDRPAAAPRRHARGGLGNMASNLVNEPVTIVSSLAVGDLATAWHASERFAINSTVGFLGWYDRAKGYGLPPVQSDIGLALCHYGVGEGGYLVLPLIGPRTVRDAVADVMIVNAILWTSLAAVLGTGASLETFLVAETIEIAADIVATRQMDPHAVALDGLDYEATRREYLRQRRQRCGDPVVAASEPAL